jgi:hypothetical protein
VVVLAVVAVVRPLMQVGSLVVQKLLFIIMELLKERAEMAAKVVEKEMEFVKEIFVPYQVGVGVMQF